MKCVKPQELRELIFSQINPTIEIHRESDENYFWLEINPPATEQEIDDFIQSIPYFAQELKDFLLNDFSAIEGMLISDEWNEEFMQRVNIWAKSCEWLGDDFLLIRDSCLSTIQISTKTLEVCMQEI